MKLIETEGMKCKAMYKLELHHKKMEFFVKTKSSAHIIFMSDGNTIDQIYRNARIPVITVLLGAGSSSNLFSVIRKFGTGLDVSSAYTSDIVTDKKYRGFWIRLSRKNKIHVGRANEKKAFLVAEIPVKDFSISSLTLFGVSSWHDVKAYWRFKYPELEEAGYHWSPSSGRIPENALQVGVDIDGGLIFVGRACHAGTTMPAKILKKRKAGYVSYQGEEHEKEDFEVLCVEHENVDWVPKKDGPIPPGAVVGGVTPSGELLYVGRVFHEDIHIPGRIHDKQRACLIPYQGKELTFSQYQVLVIP